MGPGLQFTSPKTCHVGTGARAVFTAGFLSPILLGHSAIFSAAPASTAAWSWLSLTLKHERARVSACITTWRNVSQNVGALQPMTVQCFRMSIAKGWTSLIQYQLLGQSFRAQSQLLLQQDLRFCVHRAAALRIRLLLLLAQKQQWRCSSA